MEEVLDCLVEDERWVLLVMYISYVCMIHTYGDVLIIITRLSSTSSYRYSSGLSTDH